MAEPAGGNWLDDLFNNYGLQNIKANNRVLIKTAIRNITNEIIGRGEVLVDGRPGHNLDVMARNRLQIEQRKRAVEFLGNE